MNSTATSPRALPGRLAEGFQRWAFDRGLATANPPDATESLTRDVVALRMEQVARAIYLFLLTGSVAFDTNFSHLHLTVRHLDIWITELGMAGIFILLVTRNVIEHRPWKLIGAPQVVLAALLLWGVLMMFRHTAPLVAELHDFALIYYCLFFFFFRELFTTRAQLIALLLAFGSAVAIVVVVAAVDVIRHDWVVLYNGQVRFITGQAALESAAAFCFVLAAWRLVRRKAVVVLPLIALLVVVVLVQVRSLLVALAVGIAVMLLIDQHSRALPRRQILTAAGIVVGLLAVGQLLLSHSWFGHYLLRSEQRLISGITNPGQDATGGFRLSAWAEALRRIGHQPLTGQGFGVPFQWHWGALNIDVINRPHNTYLWLAVNAGLIGLAVLVIFVATVYAGALRGIHAAASLEDYAIRLALLGALSAFVVFGALNLLLESPFLAISFWTLAAAATVPPGALRQDREANPRPLIVSGKTAPAASPT